MQCVMVERHAPDESHSLVYKTGMNFANWSHSLYALDTKLFRD